MQKHESARALLAKEGLRGTLEGVPTSKAGQGLPSMPSGSQFGREPLFLTPVQPLVARTPDVDWEPTFLGWSNTTAIFIQGVSG